MPTVTELRKKCKEKNLRGYSKLTKTQLEALLKAPKRSRIQEMLDDTIVSDLRMFLMYLGKKMRGTRDELVKRILDTGVTEQGLRYCWALEGAGIKDPAFALNPKCFPPENTWNDM